MSDCLQAIAGWIIAALAVERATELWIHGEIFAGRRNAIALWQLSDTDSKPRAFILKLVTCAWCFSAWVSLFFTPTLPGGLFQIVATNNLLTKWLALFALANTWHVMFRIANRGRSVCCGDQLYEVGVPSSQSSEAK